MTLSIANALQNAALVLTQAQSSSPRIDAQVLLCHVLDKPSSYLYSFADNLLSPQQYDAFLALIKRREQGEPVAYIIGTRDFWSLTLNVAPCTLIPRPDTERLVELALEKIAAHCHASTRSDQPIRVLDLGTGTGAIGLAIAKECPQAQVLAVDFNQQAVALAKENAKLNQVSNVEIVQSDWFSAVGARQFDCIVSNPPYIDPEDPHLHQGDVRFEPRSALVAAAHGLADIATIITDSRDFLAPDGWLLLEHGYDQGAAVRAQLVAAGFCAVTTFQDYAQLDRVTGGRWVVGSDI